MLVLNLILVCFLIVSVTGLEEHILLPKYCLHSPKPQPNYYWRKYEGVIPHDAVPGGHKPNGSINYIAQVLVTGSDKNAILPGSIQIGQVEVEVPFYGVHKSKNYIAILCSNTPSALKWRLVNEHELHLVNEYLVVGGYEIIQPAYIGRASHQNHLIVGKVFTEVAKGLRIVTPDSKELHLNLFELLVYDPTGQK